MIIINNENLENILGGSININKISGFFNKVFKVWRNISLSLRKTNLCNYGR